MYFTYHTDAQTKHIYFIYESHKVHGQAMGTHHLLPGSGGRGMELRRDRVDSKRN